MTIDGVASYGEIYSENLTDEDIKNFNDFGIEWRGRNIYDIRDDFCIKAIVIFALDYLVTARTNPAKLPELKAEIVQIFEDLFDTESDEEDEPSPLLYRFDPISGTYLELIGAEKKRLKKIGKGFKKAGKAVGKGYKKAEKAVTKGVRETGRWVREHPVETTLIVAGTAVVILTGGAAAGAFAGADAIAGSAGSAAAAGAAAAAASTAGSNNNRRKDDDELSSSSPPNHPPSQRTPPTTSSSTVSAPQPFNQTSTYTPNTLQGFSTSNPLPQDPFPHRAFSNHAYELSAAGSGSPSSHPAPLVMPTSLTYEPKTYSTSNSSLSALNNTYSNTFPDLKTSTLNPSSNMSSAHPSQNFNESITVRDASNLNRSPNGNIAPIQQIAYETAKFRPGINGSEPSFVHSQQPTLPQNNPVQSPAINKANTNSKMQEIRLVSWAKGAPIWQEGDPLPPEGMTLVAICARKGGAFLNDPTREGVARKLAETGGHAWLEFVESNGKQSSISTHRGKGTSSSDPNPLPQWETADDITDYKYDRDTIRINYLIPASKAEAIRSAAKDHASDEYNLFFHNCVHTTHEGAKVAGLDEFSTAIKPTYSEEGPAFASEILTLPSAVYSRIEKKIDELRGWDHPLITPPPEIKNEVVWMHLAADDPYHPSTFAPKESFRHEEPYLESSPGLKPRGNFGDSKEEAKVVP